MNEEQWTIGRMLLWTERYFHGKGVDTPRPDAEILLSHLMGKDRIYVYTHYDEPLTPSELDTFRDYVKKRVSGLSVAAIIGVKEFMGLPFYVDGNVLIPRPDTETLVEAVLSRIPTKDPIRIADICTGPGTILFSLLRYLPESEGVGLDLSRAAIDTASKNLERFGFESRADLRLSDMCSALENGERFDVIVSNPPYIPSAEIESLAREVRSEPRLALDGGEDGLDAYRSLFRQVTDYLKPLGYLAVEIGAGQAEAVASLAEKTDSFEPVVYERDLSGTVRVLIWQKKEAPRPLGETERLYVPTFVDCERAGRTIRSGGLVAIPTETVYGLGANGLDESAVRRIYEAKGRPSDNPLILHVPDVDAARPLVKEFTSTASTLAEAFWPGPLTMILPKSDIVPLCVTGGLDTVALRCPDHATCRRVLKAAGVPVAAPSANRSGRPSPTDIEAVLHDLDGRIDMALDGGPCKLGIESTVVLCEASGVVILRPGAVTEEMLRRVVGNVRVSDSKDEEAPRAPGMKYRHYSPDVPVELFAGTPDVAAHAMAERLPETDGRVGFLVSEETAERLGVLLNGHEVEVYGSRMSANGLAGKLYASLLRFETAGVSVVFAEGVEETGIGVAVMNRLKKAAGV